MASVRSRTVLFVRPAPAARDGAASSLPLAARPSVFPTELVTAASSLKFGSPHRVVVCDALRDGALAVEEAARLHAPALAVVEEGLSGKDYLAGDFSAADVMLGHAIFMSNRLGCVSDDMTNLKAYIARIEQRPAFQTAMSS